MCLERIAKNRFPKGTKGVGYIMVRVGVNRDRYKTVVKNIPVRMGVEYTDTNKKRIHQYYPYRYGKSNIAKSYRPGFHIWKTLEGAKRFARYWGAYSNYAILKVEWSDPVAEGTQMYTPVIVARKRKAVEVVYRVYRGKVIDNIWCPSK